MNKSDLKDGMLVRLRNGNVRVIWNNDLYEIYADKLSSCNDLSNYNDDLKSAYSDAFKELDIMRVEYNNELIWERKEVDWNKVPVGTKVLVSDNEENWHNSIFIDYMNFESINDGKLYFKVIDLKSKQVHLWRYCKLAEELQEEVTVEELELEYVKGCEYVPAPYPSCYFVWLLDKYNVTRKEG